MPETFQEAKYDVFISYSREDYIDEKTGRPIEGGPVDRLIKFLDSENITYWIDKEGIYAGAEFAEKIATAISESKMMVFISSEASNKSKWTAGEIKEASDTEKLIIPFRIDDAPYSKKFRVLVNTLDHIDFFSNPASSLQFLLKSINIEKKNYEKKVEEAKRKMAEKEENDRKERLRKEIDSDKEKYNSQASELKKDSERIIRKLKEIGEDHKACPICGSDVPLSDLFCKTCGWTFVPPFEASPSADDKERLSNAKTIWNRVQSSTEAEKALSSLEEQLAQGLKQIDRYREQQEQDRLQINRSREQIVQANAQVALVNQQMEQAKEQIKSLTEERDALLKTSRAIGKVKSETFAGHEYVDLGLPSGTLWATCNVGASKPSEYGDYFAWGETSPKKDYGWSNLNYRTSGDSYENVKFSKYVADSKYGTVDNKTLLELSDDAARSNWGGSWRMPTREEWQELEERCDWKWTKEDGRCGYKVTGQNGKSIFLPAAGWRGGDSQGGAGVYGVYWSSSLHADKSYCAFRCFFHSDGVDPSGWDGRYVGLSVRPVVSSLQ